MIKNFTLLLLAIFVSLTVKSQITVYSNNNVGVKTSTTPTESMEVNGNVKASYFIGDGSRLTNLPSVGGSSQWTNTGTNIYYSLGKVGIGSFASSVPSNLVHLYSTGSPYMQVETATNGQFAGIDLTGVHYGDKASSKIYMDYYGGTGYHGLNYISGRDGFSSHWFKDYTGAVLMCIVKRYDGLNGVGIGTTNPQYLLDVNGVIRVQTTTYTSDERLKENVKDISNSLGLIKNLKGVTYNFKTPGNEGAAFAQMSLARADSSSLSKNNTQDLTLLNGNNSLAKTATGGNTPNKEQIPVKRNHIGFVAQDVKKVFPDLVYEDKDGVMSVDYVSMIPILVESMKELNEKVVKLERENADLRKKLGVK